MKLIVLFVVVMFMFVAVDGAYALGGGGHRGDGRWDSSKDTGNGNTGGADNGSVTPAPSPSVSVPEPLTLCLLGFGIVGLAGLRRKFKK
jgi:PEP-CTERM motif-containing protein